MSGPSEHLIERAAAKLRGGSAVRLPDEAAPPVEVRVLPPVRPFTPVPEKAPYDKAAPELLPATTPPDDLPDIVPGPIPSPGAPLTRPIMAAARPALTIPPASPQARAPSPVLEGPVLGGPVLANPALGSPAPSAEAPATLNGGPASAPSGNLTPPPAAGAQPRNSGSFPARGHDQARQASAAKPAGPSSALALQPPPIVQLDALERAGMVVARTTRTRISEEYRIAIGRVLRVLHEAGDVQGARNVLMVTSARPGEGKSFTALNLAGSIAQNGTDAVLLVDVDPKVKPLSDQLGLGEVQGFLDLVSDPSLRPEDLLRVTAIPNLAIMPIGTRLGGAAQTANGTASMRPIIPTIARLARRFPKHLIMLDAPPCLSTSDPHTLAPHVGQVVVVVEAERTQRSEVEAAVDLVRVCPSITLLLNKVRMTTSHTFGAYDYFGSYT